MAWPFPFISSIVLFCATQLLQGSSQHQGSRCRVHAAWDHKKQVVQGGRRAADYRMIKESAPGPPASAACAS